MRPCIEHQERKLGVVLFPWFIFRTAKIRNNLELGYCFF